MPHGFTCKGFSSTGSVPVFGSLASEAAAGAIVLASAGRGDWILCQVTSKAYGDADAIEIKQEDFELGGLRLDSYARPGKLFTAHESLLRAEAGRLRAPAFERVRAGGMAVFA